MRPRASLRPQGWDLTPVQGGLQAVGDGSRSAFPSILGGEDDGAEFHGHESAALQAGGTVQFNL